MSETLAALAERHGTDKRPGYHDYAAIYEPLLGPHRARPDFRVLEVGISAGKSLRLWADYFPAAQIVGLDRAPAPDFDTERITTGLADQAERGSLVVALSRLGLPFGGTPPFDLVIDDGGHRMDEQQITLAVLFRYVRPDGLYVIEDVHTSFPDLYPGYGVDADGGNSTYSVVDTFVRTGRVRSRYLSDEETRYLEDHIAWCSYHFRPGRKHSDLVVLRKKG